MTQKRHPGVNLVCRRCYEGMSTTMAGNFKLNSSAGMFEAMGTYAPMTRSPRKRE